jgi:tRNA threonylcarbamoyladenosine biosynthesis protein TsaE
VAKTALEWDDLDEAGLGALAVRVASCLVPGDVVVLRGEVGAGKTTFVRSAARPLGIRETVTSPTYQFARAYQGRAGGRPVDMRDALELDEYLEPGSVTFMEWAELALDLLEEPSVVEVQHRSPTTRRVRISGPLAVRLYQTC